MKKNTKLPKTSETKISKKNVIAIASIVLFLILAKWSAFLIRQYNSASEAKEELARIRDFYVKTSENAQSLSQTSMPSPIQDTQLDESASDHIPEYAIPEKEIDFTALQKDINSDIYAWITIPGTEIDYPLVQHPTDNSYYLNHNLDGSEGYPGCIYTECYNSTTWEDPNTILYGHNMKDGSMFAGLHEYEQEEFLAEHPYVYIYSPDSINIYQIFAAYEFSDIHLFAACDWEDSTAVTEYLAQISDCPGIFNQDVPIETDSRLLTLSTCIRGKDDKRYLVQAVLAAQENG